MATTISVREPVVCVAAESHGEIGGEPNGNLLKCTEALQSTIDALTELQAPDQIIPRVLQIVAQQFQATSCAFYENDSSGRVWLRYWFTDGRTLLPHELLELDAQKYTPLVQSLAGFTVPDSYLGKPVTEVIYPVVLNHTLGTSVSEFDRLMVDVGWDLELNIGVAAGGIRASTLCVYRGSQHPYSGGEIALAESLAKQLGLAMQASRVAEAAKFAAIVAEREAAAERTITELAKANTALRKGVERISDAKTFDSILDSFLSETVVALDASGGALLLRVPGTECTFRVAAVNEGRDISRGEIEADPYLSCYHELSAGDPGGIFTALAKGETPAITVSALKETVPLAYAYHRKRDHAIIWHAPLRLRDSLIGFLGLARRDPSPPDNAVWELVKALAQQLVLALELTRLAEEARLAAIAREREAAAERRAKALARASKALQATIEALGGAMDLDQIVPKVLTIVAETFRPVACSLFENSSSGRIRLLYWNVENRTLTPAELIHLDPEKFRLVRWLAEGFEVPEAYLGMPARTVGSAVLNHVTGTAMPEFDEFALAAGWDLELNVGVGPGGSRSSTLAIYRNRTDPFAPEEIALAESLATQLGLAVQYARLAEEAKQVAVAREREEAARTRAAELAGANQVLRATLGRFAASSDTGTFLDSIVEEIARQLGADGAHLAVYDENTHTMRTAAGYAGHSKGHHHVLDFPPVISASELGAFDILRSMTAPRFFDPAVEPDLFWPGTIQFHRARGTRTVFTVPMHFGSRFTGFLGLSFLSAVKLPPERIELVQALAQQATLVVELLRLSGAEQQAAVACERERVAEARAAETQRINEFLSLTLGNMAEGSDLQNTVESIMTGFAREIGAEHVFLFRYDAVQRSIRLELSTIEWQIRRGLNGDEVPLFAAPFPADITPAWRIMTETRGLFTPAMSPVPPKDFAWPGYAEYAERFHLSDAGHIVLFAGDDPVGSIGFGLSNGRKLKPSDKPFIEGFARQAAIAIRMADLAEKATLAAVAHEREASAQERVAKLARTNHALKQTLDVVASEPDFGQVPGKLLEAIAIELQSPSAALKLFNKKSGRFEIHLVYHKGKVMEVNDHTAPLLKGVWGRGRDLVLKVHTRERRPVVYQVGELERSNPQAFRLFEQLGVRSLLGVPLLLGSEILGSLSIRFHTLRELTPDELELTQAMAHQATLAIQLTSLAARAGEAALIEERMRFARDVHDTLAQGFTGILMQLGAASQVKEESITAIEPQLEAIEALARSSLAEARRAVRSLRFLPSEEEMLERTVEQIINRARTQTNAEIGLEITGCPHSLGSRVNSELTLIIQESIHNAIKHAAAKRIIVSLEFQGESALRVSVKDDGVGFDTSSVPVDGFGLKGMQERADSIGASLTIVSEKDRGARIVVQYGRTGN